MTEKWIQRGLARMRQLGLRKADVDKRMSGDGGKGTFWTDLITGRAKSPSIDNFAKLARILNYSVGGLYEGEESAPATLFIEGVLKGDEMWQTLARTQKKEVDLSFFQSDLAVIEVASTEMQPAYRLGDILAGTRVVGRNLDNLINRDCIIQTVAGERYVKYLIRGNAPGSFNLRSFDPSVPDIENVKIAWAAPIQMIVRGID